MEHIRLETERLILRPWTIEDAADMYEYAKGPNVGPRAGWKPHENLEETKKILQMFLDSDDDIFAVEWKENHKVIGSVGLHKRKKGDIQYGRELGYVLSEEYWGRGIIPEASKAAMKYAFETLQVSDMVVSHFEFNDQSKRVIEKLGFIHKERIKESWERWDGVKLDEEVYTMTKEQYENIYN